ncbi:T9SS type A sorting domain-containing protein [candidate division WOR-3 bacterium]|nr:T9SS type A sorting domain-containing protein [candidate division WOR-3 bacterium]
MINRMYMIAAVCLVVAVSIGWSKEIILQGDFMLTPTDVEVNLNHKTVVHTPTVLPLQNTFLDSFERGALAPWVSSGQGGGWGIRDTTNTYGPQSPAGTGYRYAGHPHNDTASYPCSGANPGYMCHLTSPTISLTGWDSLYVTFSYYGDFEGEMTNFDGGIVQISSNGGSTWQQIDEDALGHLNPTYDQQLAGGSQLYYAWAYCYDTDPLWVTVTSEDLIALGYAAPGNQIQLRFTFASDALAGGEGWFIDDVRIADTPPPDQQPPTIVHTPLTDTTDTLNTYTISADVTDEGSGVDSDSVYLHYQIEQGSVIDVQMTNTGGDTYEADIPTQSWHTDVYYQITAADLAGNEKATPVYTFEVTSARTIIYDENQPYWIPGDLLPGNGLFVQFTLTDVGIDSGLVHKVMLYFDGPGPFDLHMYRGTTGNPGTLLDSLMGLQSPGYAWNVLEVTNLNVMLRGDIVSGFICRASSGDTTRLLMDPIQHYPQRMWGWIDYAWQMAPYAGGDYMIRMKVIPITYYGVEETPSETPSALLLSCTPNPLRTNTMIQYQLNTNQHVSLKIYDITGQLVTTLVDAPQEAGAYDLVWNGVDHKGSAVSSGVYFLKFQTDDHASAQKLLLIK